MHIRTLAVFVAGTLLVLGARPGLAEPVRVALLPVVVHMTDAESAPHVSGGIADMLASRLERSGEIQVLRTSSNDRSTTQLGVATEAARAMGAEWVVFGSFTQFGKGASLDLQCAPVGEEGGGGEARRVFLQSGEMAQIIPKLDALVTKISRHVLGRYPAVVDEETPTATASKPDPAVDELRARVDALEKIVWALRGDLAEAKGQAAGRPPPSRRSPSPPRPRRARKRHWRAPRTRAARATPLACARIRPPGLHGARAYRGGVAQSVRAAAS